MKNNPFLRGRCIELLLHHGRRLIEVRGGKFSPPEKVYEGRTPDGGYWRIALCQGQIIRLEQEQPYRRFNLLDGRELQWSDGTPPPDTSAWPGVRVRLIEGDIEDGEGVVYAVYRNKRTGAVTHKGRYPVKWRAYWIEDSFFVEDIVIDRGLRDAPLQRAVRGLFDKLVARRFWGRGDA